MNQKMVPAAFYPTTVVLVDDDKDYLKRIVFMLGRKHFFRSYNNPFEALKYLKEEYLFNPFTNHCVVQPEDQSSDKRNIVIDIRAIHWEIFNKNRYDEVGVLVLDHSMPELTGGDLAKHLKEAPYKKLLLTGEADAETAIKLFNEGVIHAFVRKDDPDIKNVLTAAIDKLQQEYFEELSTGILSSILQYKDLPHRWPRDSAYVNLYNQIREKSNSKESYLLDEYGSQLFLAENGKPSIFAVTNEEMMETYRDFAENDQAPNSVIEGLKSRKRMPFFFSDTDFNVRPAEWEPYMHPAERLQGLEVYYYSYIPDPKINLNTVYSYAEFLKTHG